ncbi:MAG: hypothetical protein H0U69_03345 [Trueperaceae bacterium]|nr:hypothetical protein [Trueperaceae bacterium]
MRVTVIVEDRKLVRALGLIRSRAPGEMEIIARTLAAIGKEYARDIITVVIYATPQRSGYKRTRFLLRSIFGEFQKMERGHVVTIGAAAKYAYFNELGTYDSAILPETVLDDARRNRSDLITLEYGSPERGLEPRPFILPAMIKLERELPGLVLTAYRRLGRG